MTGAVVPTATASRTDSRLRAGLILRRAWHCIPYPARMRFFEWTHRTGVPYLASFLLDHRARHHPSRFAGSIPELQEEYRSASEGRRAVLLERFDAIADSIVLANGVRKTTFVGRCSSLLNGILLDPACALPDRPLRVLDVPASTGATATESFSRLSATHAISEYVLGDLAFDLLYDRARACVFDADGTLLQVGVRQGFTSTFLPHAEGVEVTRAARMVLAPLIARGARLRRAFLARDAGRLESMPIIRPDVLERERAGEFTLLALDVFAPIPGVYDVILSFNLLQRNYFTPERVERGIHNLASALAPDGLLIVGRPDADGNDAHRVYRRSGDRVVLVRERGTL
jgi:hypothetical protein